MILAHYNATHAQLVKLDKQVTFKACSIHFQYLVVEFQVQFIEHVFCSQGSLDVLEKEIKVNSALTVDSTAEYHKSLALALMYKVCSINWTFYVTVKIPCALNQKN